MNLQYFFDGKLAKEEVASAFLAAVLEARSDFRAFFFEQLGCDAADKLASMKWRVCVEAGDVDVRLDAEDEPLAVLIENKISPGAVKEGQLRRYYLAQIQKEPAVRVWAVYLAPAGDMGEAEVQRVREDKLFRHDRDWVGQVTWSELQPFVDRGGTDGQDASSIASGFRAIRRAIEEPTTYPLGGGREHIDAAVKGAVHILSKNPDTSALRFLTWRAQTMHTILTAGTTMTVYVTAKFETGDKPPFYPAPTVVDRGRLHLTLMTEFRISALGRKSAELRDYWQQTTSRSSAEIPGLGTHTLMPSGWFYYEAKLEGTVQEVAATIADAAATLVRALRPYLR